MTVVLMSSAYASEELVAEFGKLPPAFLPVGNTRLYALQATLLQDQAQPLVMTLPDGFDVPPFDRDRLADLGIRTLSLPPIVSLGTAIGLVLDALGPDAQELTILHGDTLFTGMLPTGPDIVSINAPLRNYNWACFRDSASAGARFTDWTRNTLDTHVLSGFFRFSDAASLRSALAQTQGNFIEALNTYDMAHSLAGVTPVGAWLDFGHVQTYHRSRWFLTTERVFNQLHISEDVVSKTSAETDKIFAEAAWFETIPAELKVFAPTYLGRMSQGSDTDGQGYRIAHEFLAPLSDLFVFGSLPEASWEEIFAGCAHFLERCAMFLAPPEQRQPLMHLYQDKAEVRIGAFCQAHDLDPSAPWQINGRRTPGLAQLAQEMIARIPALPNTQQTVMHGDFCFSNILFDFRRGAIKVIDPRGCVDPSDPSPFGDPRYDLAKLSHSVLGGYDHIMAGAMSMTETGANKLELDVPSSPLVRRIQTIFSQMEFAGRQAGAQQVRASTALLFLTMLPLHSDNITRQKALLARGLMLASDLMEEG